MGRRLWPMFCGWICPTTRNVYRLPARFAVPARVHHRRGTRSKGGRRALPAPRRMHGHRARHAPTVGVRAVPRQRNGGRDLCRELPLPSHGHQPRQAKPINPALDMRQNIPTGCSLPACFAGHVSTSATGSAWREPWLTPATIHQPEVECNPDGMGLGLYYANLAMELNGGHLAFPEPQAVGLSAEYDGAIVAVVFGRTK